MTEPTNVDEGHGRPLARPESGPRVTAVDVAGMPWAFTHYEPLNTGDFISRAERQGVYLDTGRLRQLYRRGRSRPATRSPTCSPP
jgi:hypothetical protein